MSVGSNWPAAVLASTFGPNGEARKLHMAICVAYLEDGSCGASATLTVAGLVAPKAGWRMFEERWPRALRAHGLSPMAAPCRPRTPSAPAWCCRGSFSGCQVAAAEGITRGQPVQIWPREWRDEHNRHRRLRPFEACDLLMPGGHSELTDRLIQRSAWDHEELDRLRLAKIFESLRPAAVQA